MKNKILLSLSLLSLGLLHACGGGGGDSGPAALLSDAGLVPAASGAPAAGGGDSGSVSAPFVRSESARYQLLGVGSQVFGRLTQSEQAANGAMTRLNDTTLDGPSVTKDIAGDASFAIGRWVAGTVTRTSGAETLTGKDNRAYHYIVLNELKALPDSGSFTCDTGVFTRPTYVGGGASAADSGTASGSASLSFEGGTASVVGAVKIGVGDASASVDFDAKVASPSSTAITGSYLSGGTGAGITLGDHGDGRYAVAVGYAATLASGARYAGIAKFRCK